MRQQRKKWMYSYEKKEGQSRDPHTQGIFYERGAKS